MGNATFSFDVALDSPSRHAIFAAVRTAVGDRTRWRLLSRQWMIRFASIADFEAFGGALEVLHDRHPREFDYFALHFDAAGGPVVIAPNPNRRSPSPIPGAAARALPTRPEAAAAGIPATVTVDDPAPVLSRLRDLHAFDDWETSPGDRPRVRRARRVRRTGSRRGRAGAAPRRRGAGRKRTRRSSKRTGR